MQKFLCSLLFCLLIQNTKAERINHTPPDSLAVVMLINDSADYASSKPGIFKGKLISKQKMTALILSFPFPFGIVGLHRIYMGCAPYVPVAYIASLGGAFGLVPLIDFFVILFERDLQKFINSKQVFMWVK